MVYLHPHRAGCGRTRRRIWAGGKHPRLPKVRGRAAVPDCNRTWPNSRRRKHASRGCRYAPPAHWLPVGAISPRPSRGLVGKSVPQGAYRSTVPVRTRHSWRNIPSRRILKRSVVCYIEPPYGAGGLRCRYRNRISSILLYRSVQDTLHAR